MLLILLLLLLLLLKVLQVRGKRLLVWRHTHLALLHHPAPRVSEVLILLGTPMLQTLLLTSVQCLAKGTVSQQISYCPHCTHALPRTIFAQALPL